MADPPDTAPSRVLVSDFDGTMTRHDFYKLAIEWLLPPDTPDHWAEYRAGTITHFEALRRYFARSGPSEAEVLAVVDRMELDPDLPRGGGVACGKRGGTWSSPRPGATGTSAGCWPRPGWRSKCTPNPGRFEAGRGAADGDADRFAVPVANARRGQGRGRPAAPGRGPTRWRSPATGSPTRRPPGSCPASCGSPAATWRTC